MGEEGRRRERKREPQVARGSEATGEHAYHYRRAAMSDLESGFPLLWGPPETILSLPPVAAIILANKGAADESSQHTEETCEIIYTYTL